MVSAVTSGAGGLARPGARADDRDPATRTKRWRSWSLGRGNLLAKIETRKGEIRLTPAPAEPTICTSGRG
jgi:hypothetical protein